MSKRDNYNIQPLRLSKVDSYAFDNKLKEFLYHQNQLRIMNKRKSTTKEMRDCSILTQRLLYWDLQAMNPERTVKETINPLNF